MARKLSARLVALSASAVATIYVAGLFSTRAGADRLAAASADADPTLVVPTPAAVVTTTAADPTSTSPAVIGAAAPAATPTSVPAATATTTPAAAAISASTSAYADGTYSGTGTSRLGNVSVSVAIAGGKISNVQITAATTKYPVSRIATLPGKVVQGQTASISSVSGATYSSQAFKQAVQQALAAAAAAARPAAAVSQG
jgi:uncharacterized protein with FMN-binding domain